MYTLKPEMIGAMVWVPQMGKQIKVTPERTEFFRRLGMTELFIDRPKPKRKTKVTQVSNDDSDK